MPAIVEISANNKTFTATPEQMRAIELFETGESIRINAYAGAGKTLTLQFLAAQHPVKRGRYLTFSKDLAKEAASNFPEHVVCSTVHSLARSLSNVRSYPEDKWKKPVFPKRIAEVLRLKRYVRFSSPFLVFSNGAYAAVLKRACDRFLYSTDVEPNTSHFERRYGKLALLTDDEFQHFAAEALPKLQELWKIMRDPSGALPLGHDGYVKLWSLAPVPIPADFVLLDEAQDSNPVMLHLLEKQGCQVIYVGDPYQQIYEWRGAVDAMNYVKTKHRTVLTKSFRYGQAIADAATKIIKTLGAADQIVGDEKKCSHLGPVDPEIILCRTAFSVVANLMECLAQNLRCYLIGNAVDEYERLLQSVKRLKQGKPSDAPEFFGFENWDEVRRFAEDEEGEHLRRLVKLVDQFGEDRLLEALSKCTRKRAKADIVLSTVHGAKGGEWDTVRLDRDFESRLGMMNARLGMNLPVGRSTQDCESEIRLLYVAITRAKFAVEIPNAVMELFGLHNTTAETSRGEMPRQQSLFAFSG